MKNQKVVVLGITDDYDYMDILRLAGQFGLSPASPGSGESEATPTPHGRRPLTHPWVKCMVQLFEKLVPPHLGIAGASKS